ncbi:hypothetical protein AB0J86_25580 [Micromonospora sp. NPDC049559]|uniref:hypothetical protein n=1 Tax=Micromonospora sp. NPDC049559 TaxID=3155923 RepID=UPI00343C521C
MILRLVLLELRRTLVLWPLLAVALATRVLFADGMDPVWPGLVNESILGHRINLSLLWPLVAAVGAGVGRRDRAAGVSELVAGTPRRPWSRLAPTATVVGLAVAGAYLVTPADRLFLAALDRQTYWPAGWPWTLLVGAAGMVAAALLGLALGRLLPTRKLLPLVLLLAVALAWLGDLASRGRHSPLFLLLPTYLESGADLPAFTTVAGRTNLGQALWFVALAVAGYLLYARPRPASRRALLPAVAVLVAGLVGALVTLPSADRAARYDTRAAAPVCADGLPRVCVARAYAKVLPELTGPAREALRALGRLPDPPSAVAQETHYPGFQGTQPPETVLVRLTLDGRGRLVTGPRPMVEELLDGAGTLRCGYSADEATETRVSAARAVAGAWLLGRTGAPAAYLAADQPATDRAWAALHRLTPEEQRARVAAVRAAGLRCRDDVYEVLLGTA